MLCFLTRVFINAPVKWGAIEFVFATSHTWKLRSGAVSCNMHSNSQRALEIDPAYLYALKLKGRIESERGAVPGIESDAVK